MICRASVKHRRMPSLRHVPLMADALADAKAISLADAKMSKLDLCTYRARRKDGEKWLVKIFGSIAAEFLTRDQARTFADFAPILIAQGTCPACLEKHADLRAHIGTAPCAAKREAVNPVNAVTSTKGAHA